jgi:hypothetical protein
LLIAGTVELSASGSALDTTTSPPVGVKLEYSNGTVTCGAHITHEDAGIAFPNHMLVRCQGTYWDPTLGIAFSGAPQDVFEDYEAWDTPSGCIYKRETAPRWVAKIADEALLGVIHKQLGNSSFDTFFSDNPETKSVGTNRGPVSVPIELWTILNAKLISDLRDCLRAAITAYESRSFTAFRKPSVNSRNFLILIRKYLGMGDEPQKNKYQRHNEQQKTVVQARGRWTDAKAVETVWEIVNPANSAKNLVGDSLRDAITNACKGNQLVWDGLRQQRR